MGRIEALPENELRSKTCLDCAVLQPPQEEAGTLHLEPADRATIPGVCGCPRDGRDLWADEVPKVGQMGEAFIVLKLVIRRCLICENRFSWQAVRLRRKFYLSPPSRLPAAAPCSQAKICVA
jgi:hypothetical protein